MSKRVRLTLDDVPGWDYTLPAPGVTEDPTPVDELPDSFWYCYDCNETWELDDAEWLGDECPFCQGVKTDILSTADYITSKERGDGIFAE